MGSYSFRSGQGANENHYSTVRHGHSNSKTYYKMGMKED
jgi:hypothetical protein